MEEKRVKDQSGPNKDETTPYIFPQGDRLTPATSTAKSLSH